MKKGRKAVKLLSRIRSPEAMLEGKSDTTMWPEKMMLPEKK